MFVVELTYTADLSEIDAAMARARAMKLFGGIEQHREAAHDMRGTRQFEDFAQEIKDYHLFTNWTFDESA